MVEFDQLTEEQQDAADALDRNVTLTAGAGTGKTTTLTARYMRMLARGLDNDAPEDAEAPLLPEEILTTTFTERAANELKASVREAITDRVADADADTYAEWREVADGLEDGYIHTLHGFCARLLREHAISADAVDPGFDTLDERETTALLDDTVATLLETHDDHEAVQTLARRFDRSALQDILTDLLTERPGGIEWAERWADAPRDEYLDFVDTRLHPIPPTLAAERFADPTFVAAVDTLTNLLEAPPDALETGGQTWTRAVGILDLLDGISLADGEATTEKRDRFVALCDHLTTGSGSRYASYTGANGRWSGAESEKAQFDGAMAAIVDILEPEAHLVPASMAVDANSVPFVQALARLTLLAHDEYVEQKRRRNVVDFTDQIEFALEFLQDAPDALRADLREQFAYVMVDEFQDTDPRQWELIAHLTAEDPDAFDARNVFVVGDTKQSIYRFRNADVTQFAATERELEAANPQGDAAAVDDQLATNFRTLPGVLDGINALFDEVFEADPDAPDYEATPQPLTTYRDDPESLASLEYLAVPTDADYRARRFDGPFGDAQPEHDAELEGMALAARLTALFEEPAQIYDEASDLDDPEARPVEPEDVAILLRSRTHLKQYERALEDAEIPFTVASGLGFFDTPEVTALVNLLRALADPGDERALYGALRSPLFGLTDDTLARLNHESDSLWAALGTADDAELQAVHDRLVEWREQVGLGDGTEPQLDGSWAAFLTQVIDDTGYLTSVSVDERGRQAVANVEKFRELLRGYSDDGVTSLPTLVRRLDRQQDLGDREGEATIQGGGAGVKLLTVHDAKGLEFPVVVVPGISKGFNMRAAVGSGRVEFEDIGDDEYAIGLKAPAPDDPFDDATTVAREALKDQRRAEERAEEKRVLYVACTRARDRLLLTGLHDLDGDDLTEIDAANPDEASSWRDWVQPQLLPDDVLDALETQPATTTQLGGGDITVTLPTPAADWRDHGEPAEPRVERSATPARPARQFRLSPTALASLFDGHGSLQLDERTNTVYFDSDDDHGGELTAETATESLAPTVFGELVHRLCELRPPEEHWDDVVEQTLAAEDVEGPLDGADQTRVREHAERAMDYVDARHADCDVEYTYDELYVTAEFDDGEVSGLIDHLISTPDAYHIIDYKTNDITSSEVTAKADYYRTQMAAYAVALQQNEPDKTVTATLYFTTPGEPYQFEWPPEELSALASELRGALEPHLDDLASLPDDE
ncbi:UvrD-helicase domain-containing protein [Halorarius litoreus]|uniref:UvrD-helicase domain-containing protein n=1 Tax=Halorarius litoreus TaxID=2962676 RepID=UPI0020CB8DB5|nr:UvrD-helicase domain-containing protein [Halorarius litoreus]